MTKYGRSPWLDQCPKSLVPAYPVQRGRTFAEAVIVGGGLTGCTTAYLFAAAGVRVVLVDAEQIGRGGTSLGAGWAGSDPGVRYGELEKALGRRAAHLAWQAWHRAGLDFAAFLRRLGIKCSLEPRVAMTVATDPDQASRLRREQKMRLDAGIEAPWLNSRGIGAAARIEAAGGIRDGQGATLDPYRAAVGLASAVVKRGARLCERSPVTRIEFGRRTADVYTPGGTIRTTRVIIATGVPTALFKALQRHFWFRHTYLAMTTPVPVAVRRRLGPPTLVVRDSSSPPHVVRWIGADRLLVMGADAEEPPSRHWERISVQRTGQLMYELSTLYPDVSGIQPEYGWHAPLAVTRDGLPFIGPHRNYPHHLFAFGDASRGVTGAFLAGRALLRHHVGRLEPADRIFEFR